MMRRLRPVGEKAPLPSLRAQPQSGTRRSAAQSRAIEGLQFPGWITLGFETGTTALAAAIKLAKRRKRTRRPRVIVSAYGCPDIVSAAVFAGAEVVLADTLPDSPWLDPAAVTALLTPDTVAVVYLRFLGLPANDLALRAALAGSDVLLIEDCAHSFPQTTQIESSADLLVLSFGRGKPIPLRSGGALLQRIECAARAESPLVDAAASDSLLRRVAYWRRCMLYNVGIQPNVYWALTQLGRLSVDKVRWNRLRSISGLPPAVRELLPAAIDRYRMQDNAQQQLLASVLHAQPGPWMDLAKSTVALSAADVSSVRSPSRLSRYPLLLPSEADRDSVFKELWDQGLGASRLYNGTLADLPHAFRFVKIQTTKNATDFAKRFLALPLHSDVRTADFELMARTLAGRAPRLDGLAAELT